MGTEEKTDITNTIVSFQQRLRGNWFQVDGARNLKENQC